MAIWGVKSESNLKKMCKELEIRVTHIEGATGTLNMNNVNAEISALKSDVQNIKTTLQKLNIFIEKEFGKDIDGDGIIGENLYE